MLHVTSKATAYPHFITTTPYSHSKSEKYKSRLNSTDKRTEEVLLLAEGEQIDVRRIYSPNIAQSQTQQKGDKSGEARVEREKDRETLSISC